MPASVWGASSVKGSAACTALAPITGGACSWPLASVEGVGALTSVIFVPAGEEHRFTDITEDLALLVVFGPAYGTRSTAEQPA